MKKYVRSNVYKWSDGSVINSDLSRNEFQEKYTNMLRLQKILKYYECDTDTYNKLVDKVDAVISSDNFDGNISFTKDEKLLLYLISIHGSQSTSSVIHKFSKYVPRVVQVGEDKYNYCGWTIQLHYSDDESESTWACISPEGDWDFSADSIADAKRSINSAIFPSGKH